MGFEIIPAIDLFGGQAVRLRKGDFGTSERVADDPVATAIGFERAGATRIHIVDLDGAKTGEAINHPVIKAILAAVSIPVQVGGGLRTPEKVGAMLALGASRVIVGTSAAGNPAKPKSRSKSFPRSSKDKRGKIGCAHGSFSAPRRCSYSAAGIST